MRTNREIPAESYRVVKILTPKLAADMEDHRMRIAATHAGFPVLTDWHPSIPTGWGEFPRLPFERSVVYRGSSENWAYSHHQAIAKLGDYYVASWSNGFLHEDYVGQEVHYARSADCRHWEAPEVLAHTTNESQLVRHNAGLFASGGRLCCYVGVAKDYGRDVAPPGMSVLKEQHIRLDAYETEDLTTWIHHEGICDNVYLFEGPRKTRSGKLMCSGKDLRDGHGMILIWDDPSRPADRPRVVDLPRSPGGVKPGQGTWYQTDDGRIWMFAREYSLSCRLGLTWSDDEGATWSDLVHTDFPNTFSRAYAGRLNDGRYYIVGNNYDRFLDRTGMQIALSDDGYLFDRQYTLIEGPTTRRINGRHKEDGYHYPNCHADGDNLLVVYSVNKEDIEIGVVDMSRTA